MEEKNEEKKVRAKQSGRALEIDIIKKIGHQIDRLPVGSGAGERILAYVQSALAEHKLKQATNLDKNGQPSLPGDFE